MEEYIASRTCDKTLHVIKKGGQFVNTPKVPPHSQGFQVGIFSRGWAYSFCSSYVGFMDNIAVTEWFRLEYRGKSSSGDKVIIFCIELKSSFDNVFLVEPPTKSVSP